jgi:hypothetical protein
MSTTIDVDRLRYELAIRGMSAVKLADKAHLSPATVSAALAGKPIAEASLELIGHVLERTPASDFLRRLVAPVAKQSGADKPPASPPAEQRRPSAEHSA